MTDSPTSQAMHLAMTELEHRRERIAVLEDVLRNLTEALDNAFISSWQSTAAWQKQLDAARSVLNKEKQE